MRDTLLIVAGAICLVMFFLTGDSFASDEGNKNVYKTKVGSFEVFMLSEAQRESEPSILIGASKDDLKKYMPSGKYTSAVCAFILRSGDFVALFDTGFGRELFNGMDSIGVKPEDVDSLLITHSHGDHIGGLVKDGSPAFPNAVVYIAKPEYEWSNAVRDALSGYTGRVEQITPGELRDSGAPLTDGVRAIAAYGHTPGHTIFLIESGEEKLLIWGDLTHAMAIQMPRPEISVTYDSDPVQAAAVRKAVLKYAFDGKIPVAGMHIAYPGIGRLERDPEIIGSYRFIPLP
jgi:glyoxylase-like metal-dependent hydrolase (beta-lactamase superfamily II)